MNALARTEHEVETQFLNEVADYPGISLTVHYSCNLKESGLDWSDVIQVCREGVVIKSDMLENRGFWTVLGATISDEFVEMDVAVNSTEMRVELFRATKNEG